MSNDVIISVENLGKKYRISHQGERQHYVALRDVIAQKAKQLFSRGQKSAVRSQTSDLRPPTSAPGATSDLRPPTSGKSSEDFWALRDVSFEVKRGEVVGIIGRNGAGKSTLLKILSRITEPTKGRVHLRGRVASLLEVGTGFHPELTGRENVFLNGAILGMSRVEIKRKFDEIVAFAEVEKFLDTPVKRYSSGMYVRLAFAVAAHLEPEILIVDEVLAVGDGEFQKKCLGKMKDVAGHGRTVLFVSHNMTAITSLTQRAVLLRKGIMDFQGTTNEVVARYLNSIASAEQRTNQDFGSGEHVTLKSVAIIPNRGEFHGIHQSGSPLTIVVEVEKDDISGVGVDVLVVAANGTRVGATSVLGFNGTALPSEGGLYRFQLKIEPIWLVAGRYSIDVGVGVAGCRHEHYVEGAILFDVPFCNPLGGSWSLTDEYKYGAIALVVKDPVVFQKA